jgi:hypothetical protein
MLILEVLLNLKSKQGDVTAAFLHADLDKGEKFMLGCHWDFAKKGNVFASGKVSTDYDSHPGCSGSI